MNREQFFQTLDKGSDDDPQYDDSKYIHFLNCLGRISNDAFYIIDYKSKNFLHVVSSGLYLADLSAEQVCDDGFRYYERIVHPIDLQLSLQVNRIGYDFIHAVPLERRMNVCLSYDLRIHDNRNNWRLVNQRLVPLELTPSGVVRLAVCKIGASSSDKPGNAMITLTDSFVSYRFSETEQVFVEVGKPKLSNCHPDNNPVKSRHVGNRRGQQSAPWHPYRKIPQEDDLQGTRCKKHTGSSSVVQQPQIGGPSVVRIITIAVVLSVLISKLYRKDQESYAKKVGLCISLDIGVGNMVAIDKTGETKFDLKAVEAVNEVPNIFCQFDYRGAR